MEKYFYHKDGVVKFISDKKQETTLSYIKYKPTKEEKEKIKANWHPKIDGKKIKLEKPAYLKKQEKQESIEDIKNKLKNISDTNTKQLLEQILNIIET